MHASLRLYVQASLVVFSFFIFGQSLVAQTRDAGSTIRGTVTDPQQRPVPGATIVIEGPAAAPVSLISDANGSFVVATGVPGRFTVQASAPGLASGSHVVDVADQATVVVDLTLRVSAIDEQLVVTATQVDQPLSRVPDSTTVISGETLAARQQFSAGQALRSVPGLTVQQSGGPGSLTSLFTRGGESDFTLVLIDGIRANAFGGGVDLSQVPLADVERIEVVRGPQSALYGADAIGGVVQIITRSGGAPSAQGLLEGGGRGMWRGAASTTGEARGFRWQLGGDRFEEDGFTGQAANGETVSNDDARTTQAAVTLGWRHVDSGADLQGTVRYVDTDRGTPGPYGSDPAGRFGGVDRTSRNLTTRNSGGARWIQPWFGASSRVRQRTELDVADYDLTNQSSFPSEGESQRTHVRTQTDVAASATLGFTGGLEWLGEQGSSTYITAGSGEVPVERAVLGLFGEARWNVASRLSLTGGLRGERIHRDAFPGDPFAFTPRPDFPADTITSVNPKIAANWMVAGDAAQSPTWTRVHAAAGTGIRPPDAFEIAFTDNSGLKPERSRSFDVGVAQALAGGAIQLDATVFDNNYDDLIISVGSSFSGVSRWRTDNISNARARGAEFTAAWRPVAALSVQGTYTFLSTEILAVDDAPNAPPPYSVGDQLLRRPQHQGSIDANWSRSRAGAFLQVLMRGEALDAEPAFGPSGGLYDNPGYTVTNFGGSFTVGYGVTVIGRVMNAFDAEYEEVLGYPAPRRTAYVGIRFAASR